MMGRGGTLIERGATVEDGPLAEEQVKLVELLNIARMQAQERAHRSILTPKQRKWMDKQKTKALNATSMEERQRIQMKMQQKLQSEMTPQSMEEMKRATMKEMTSIQQEILGPQETKWLEALTPEQKEVWTVIQNVLAQKAPNERPAFGREGQIKIGKMLSEEQSAYGGEHEGDPRGLHGEGTCSSS